MKSRIAVMLIGALVLLLGVAGAEQVRLRNGRLLQCEILQERSDEDFLTVRLYSTGGVFQLRWKDLIAEDEDRLRDALGLKPWEETEVPLIPGHVVTFTNGTEDRGLALNPDDRKSTLRLKRASGIREYSRDRIAKISPAQVEITEVYSLDEIYGKYLEEGTPETGLEQKDLADRLMQVGDYPHAEKHYTLALEDPDLPEDQALVVRNRLERVKILVRAKDAVDKRREIMKLRARKKFDDALKAIDDLEKEYAESPAILTELDLDRLRTRMKNDRRQYYSREVARRFSRVLNDLVSKKVRDRDSSIGEVQAWTVNPKGLKQELFDTIAEDLGIESVEVQELWNARTHRMIRRYSYDGGTFIHPDVAGRAKRIASPRRRQKPRARNRPIPRGAQRNAKPKTKEEWWKAARPKDRANFVKAWFAEFEPEVLKVLRVEKRTCPTCGGTGVLVTHNLQGGGEVKKVCPTCNLAGYERIVICR